MAVRVTAHRILGRGLTARPVLLAASYGLCQQAFSVLLGTIDTLRADFLGAYGRREARRSVINGLSNSGFLFTSGATHSILSLHLHPLLDTGPLCR